MSDTKRVSESAWTDDRAVRCRCGQMGVVTGVEGADAKPDKIWVTHRVGMADQTHIHRSPQMSALLAQLSR